MLAYCHDPDGSLLSSSPCTVISLFLLVVDHVDKTGRRHRGERTKAEDDGEASGGNEQEPGKITASRGRREQGGPAGAGLAFAARGRRD